MGLPNDFRDPENLSHFFRADLVMSVNRFTASVETRLLLISVRRVTSGQWQRMNHSMQSGTIDTMNYNRLAVTIAITVASTTALASPQAFKTSRSLAMGGTGVAIAHPATANIANPAMLAAKNHDWKNDFGLIIPSIHVAYADEEEVVDQIDELQDNIDRYDDLVNSGGSVSAIQTEAETVKAQLQSLDRDTMRVDAGAGLSLAIPNETLHVGIFTDASVRATVRGNVSQNDLDKLQSVIDGAPASSLEDDLKSNGRVLAAGYLEAGISLGRSFDMGLDNPVQLGISPKYVQMRTYQYTAMVNDFDEDDFDAGDYETSKSGFNMDLGAAYAFGESEQWNAGMAVKNVIPMELDSKYDPSRGESEQTFELNPMVTAGIAHTGTYHVLTAEAELTERKAFGYGDDTQWLSVGAEFDAWRFLQLRVGARHNIASNDDNDGIEEKNQLTAGLGLSFFGARVDVAGMVSDADLGGSVEIGAAF